MDQPSSTESNAITLRIKFKSASLDEFINRYGVDVSPGGIFIRTKQPVDVGTTLQFDFTLADGSPLLAGLGTVAWVRESDPARSNNVPGMGLRFDKLTLESQHTHQMILSEKARKEGKSLSTPYPPTSFVAPAARPPSPSPDGMRTAAEIAARMEGGSANLAVTRPAPATAAKSPQVAAVAPTAAEDGTDGDTDEFASAGKTEISDKPLDFYLKEAAREAEEIQTAIGKPAGEAVPTSLIEDFNTDAESLPTTRSGPPPAGYDAKDSSPNSIAEDLPAAKPLSGERRSGGREAFNSLLSLGEESGTSTVDVAAPSEILEEISAGAPLEETTSEKTEEVSMGPVQPLPEPSRQVPEPFDLGAAPLDDDRPPQRTSEIPRKHKGSGKLIAGIAVLAAAAAFGAVYLAKTKPWQDAQPESTPVAAAKPTPAPAPAAELVAAKPSAPPSPEPTKPAAQEEPVGKKGVAEEPKPVAMEKTAPEKPAAEKAADKPVAEKPSTEKPGPEKASAEKPSVAKTDNESTGSKASSKSGSKPASKSGEEKSGADAEEVHRLVFKSTPIGAEVLIDGEYFGRTPCERRVLDPTKSFAILVRKEGYEPHERLLGASDNWVKRGSERVLNVTVNLKKGSSAAASAGVAPSQGSVEAKPSTVQAEAAKLSPPKPEPAKPEAVKPEPAKPVPAPAEKASAFKPVPNFDESGKAKE